MKTFEEIGAIMGTLGGILGVVGIVTLIVAHFKTNTAKATIENYEKYRTSVEARVSELERKHDDNVKIISDLRKEVDVVKNIPLASILETQTQILDILKVQAENISKLAEK